VIRQDAVLIKAQTKLYEYEYVGSSSTTAMRHRSKAFIVAAETNTEYVNLLSYKTNSHDISLQEI
jgi:hypothetical protein